MTFIVRPTKPSSGNQNFENADTISASEVNADYDSITAVVNGNVDDSNVVAGAAIAGSKLNLTGYILDAHINAAANINGSKLLAASVDTTQLAADAVTAAKVATGAHVLADSATSSAVVAAPTQGAWTDLAAPQITGFTLAETSTVYLTFHMPIWYDMQVNTAGTYVNVRFVQNIGGGDQIISTHTMFGTEETDNDKKASIYPTIHAVAAALPAATYTFKMEYYFDFSSGSPDVQFSYTSATFNNSLVTPRTLIAHAVVD